MINKGPCSNCGKADWAAKNNDYCTSCEHEYVSVLRQIVCLKPNPIQSFADAVFDGEVQAMNGKVELCTYPSCRCPLDMGAETICFVGKRVEF